MFFCPSVCQSVCQHLLFKVTSKNPSLRSEKINDFKSLLTILIIICFEFDKNIE